VPRVLIRLMVLVVVLLVLVVIADRVGAALAARTVADRLTRSESLGRAAAVSFPDVPFLTQAARGRYSTVHVTLEELPTTAGVVVDRIDATLHEVAAPTGPLLRGQVRSLQVERGEADAFVSFDALERTAQQRLGSAVRRVGLSQATSGNRVTLSASVQTPVGAYSVRGQLELTVSGGTAAVRLLPQTLTGVPTGLRTQVAGMIDLGGLAPKLPFGFTARSVTVEPAGLRLAASGTGLAIPL
jgi:hypothetical protein